MDKSIRVCAVHNQAESILICRLLEEDGIPFVLRKTEDVAYDGILIPQKGWGFIEAPETQARRILEIVNAVREGRSQGRTRS
jgi:hypothetical protein